MTPLDEAPEQRWRRTVDRRNRPAKLKVDRLLRDFGYAQLDAEVGDAIEARLAGVALAVAPSLRDATATEVVTIYANDSAAAQEAPPAADAPGAEPAPMAEPAAAADVATMVTYLKQQVLDARAEAERLRGELDRRIAARADFETEAQAIIAEQAAALDEQSRQIAELAAALDQTRQALAETRDEIRRAVGELQALPELPPLREESAEAGDDEAGDDRFADEFSFDEPQSAAAVSPAGDEPVDDLSFGEEPAADVSPGDEEAQFAADISLGEDPPAEAVATGEEEAAAEPSLSGTESADGREEAEAWVPEALRGERRPAAADRRASARPALAAVPDAADAAAELGAADDPDLDAAGAPPPAGELDQPAAAGADTPEADIDEPPLGAAPAPLDAGSPEFDIDEPPLGTKPAAPPGEVERIEDALAEWQPSALTAQPDPAGAAAEAPSAGDDPQDTSEEDLLTDFDDSEEPFEPSASDPRGDDPRTDRPGPDGPATTLPPPPPAPPSPFVEDPADQAPPVHARATLGKVLRARGGRGRWDGTCSICGRLPVEKRRKDLEAAGWDLDDQAAACPQCRGIG